MLVYAIQKIDHNGKESFITERGRPKNFTSEPFVVREVARLTAIARAGMCQNHVPAEALVVYKAVVL
jgi:hypothetical protein